ncbi:LysM peptidoglycan-binding domain-containing protein [Roseomonas sp. WA12]
MTDASRLRVVGGVAMMAGVVALAAFLGNREWVATPVVAPVPPHAASVPRGVDGSVDRPAAQSPDRIVARPDQSSGISAQPDTRPARTSPAVRPELPRFDVVRMGARGMVVVAGRAAPGAEVVLVEGGREIGRARADSRGEWVILPSDPMGAGARELSLRARLPGGDEMAGPDTVLVVGPAPAEPQVAEAPAREASRREASAAVTARETAPALADAAVRAAGPRTEGPVEAGSSMTGRQPAGTQRAGGRTAEAPVSDASAIETSGSEAKADETRVSDSGAAEAARPEQSLVLLLPPTSAAAPRTLSAPPSTAPARLGLDLVDYDDSNTMRFAGTAPPGAQLRIYSDDRHLGDTQADAAGRWSLTPAEAPPVGRHMLRVDQLGSASGAAPSVTGRVEVAFQRESLPPGAIRDGQVVVQPGNNLWRIARDAYGRGIRYTVIYRANQAQIRNPSRIYPGQVFAVPEVR